MRMLFFAHSGLRYLVLVVGLGALAYFAYAAATGKGSDRAEKVLGSAFVGLLDLQGLIGIGMVALGLYYSALLGHIFMMIAAAVIAHVAMAMARSAPPEKAVKLRLAGVLVALILIVGGIMAIGRPIFGTGVPSIN